MNDKMNAVLLKGVVGSTAYGLAHAESDVDYLGIFAEDTRKVLGLNKVKESIVTNDPDTTFHEARKFVQLCLNGNPSVSELLWLDSYEMMTDLGAQLINLRYDFLSAARVRDSYLGYAHSQFGRLFSRGDGSFSADTRKRTEKHARHLVRLVEQGFYLYTTGELIVNMESSASEIDPEWVFQTGKSIADNPDVARSYMEGAKSRFDNARTCLEGAPNRAPIEQWLLRVRCEFWPSA